MDVTKKLMLILEDRGWSEYRLAKESNLPYSTVLNIFQRNNQPSISTLEAMCNGLGITLAQFFTEDESLVMLTEEQKEILEKYEVLSKAQKEMIVDLLNVMFRHFEKC
ncbi:DNA-binding transcriptional repressor PuuR [uncultured Ruminococcus sp.]|nr:DNA-binding transcriptional repressor PuuR [uncultured Ruminococcus sp.]